MKDLAKVAGLSTTHFNRQFIKLLGVSPTQLLHAIRIDRARDLLVRSDQCIVEIAVQVGYYDQSHFTRHFRKQCGLTPRSYRARFRK